MGFGLVSTILAFLAASLPAQVTSSRTGNTFVLKNGIVTVNLDAAKGTFTASSGAHVFVRSGKFERQSGTARVADARGLLGAGKSITLSYPDGTTDQIALYAGLPFVSMREDLGNPSTVRRVVKVTAPFHLETNAGKPAESLNVFGTDGLGPAVNDKTSYSFLAIADPQTRSGIVTGWLTHQRASGIVASKSAGGTVVVEGRAEYGTLGIRPGAHVEGETFVAGYFADAFTGLESYADAVAKVNRVHLLPLFEGGYSTWYHAKALDEKRMASLADFARDRLKPYGFGVLQIDDEWQLDHRDFTTHKPDGPYPSGMKPTADTIRGAGMIAGLWFIPTGWDPKRPEFAAHQDWFVHRQDGTVYTVDWAGTCLDMTHPEARRFVCDVTHRITQEWGFNLIKTDGMWTGLAARTIYPKPDYRPDDFGDAVFHDPDASNVQAFRQGLRTVREGAGENTFILGCNLAQNMRTMGGSFGLVDSMRIGPDTGTRWKSMMPGAQMGTRLYFFHRRVWYNDPDCVVVRPQTMSLDQARAWASWIALSGQVNLDGDDLQKLPPERLDILQRTMPNHGLMPRPVDLFENPFPRIWQLTKGYGESRRDVIGVFNWDETKAAHVKMPLDRLGLQDGEYVVYDYWSKMPATFERGMLETDLPSSSCRILAIKRALKHPQVVSTSRHVTQGVIDLESEDWNAHRGVLSGVSAVVGGDPYEIRIHAPAGWKFDSATAQFGKITGEANGVWVRLLFKTPRNGKLRWSAAFKRI